MHARRLALLIVAACAATALGCHRFDLFDFRDDDAVRGRRVAAALRGEEGHSKLIGDYINISGLNTVVLEGVGLVTMLDGTGDDPPASTYRTALLDEMRRRKIENPNEVLHDPNTTLVLVRAYLPPLIRKDDHFDVEVRLPDGSEATSLNGGWLLECDLTEQAIVPGRGVLKGSIVAKASGPVLVATGDGEEDVDAAMVRRGAIPGGALYVGDERNLSIFLRSDYRGVRMSKRIGDRIGERFHDYDHDGIKRPLAEGKTDSRIELIVHSRYRDNFPRYLQCIRHLRLNETPVDRRMRLETLRDEIQAPAGCARAALECEAIGVDSLPILKQALKSPLLEVRFHAAEALAYLGNADGVSALAEAVSERAFRVYALAAMAALDSGEAALALAELMNHESIETRYGAFRALSIRSANDVYVNGIDMDGKFKLHVVESTGSPLVHLTRKKKSEIVIFGGDQHFLTPMVVRAGKHVLIKGETGAGAVTISRFAPGEPDRQIKASARVSDVIRAVSDLGASYPDIVQMLVQAEKQHNLAGRIGIDALPGAGRTYHRRPVEGTTGADDETTIGDEGMAPNLFDAPAGDAAVSGDSDQFSTAEKDFGPVGFGVK